MNGAMAGFRVLDLVDGLGAYGPKLLGGLGADVVRLEPPGGSTQRRASPLLQSADSASSPVSLHFAHYNAGKMAITLDTGTVAGLRVLERLLDQFDVVFDNGALAGLGFELDKLAGKSPPLVIVSITPFGLNSVRSTWLGGDLICQAMSGMISYYGYRGERPARFGPHQASEISGLAAALGAQIALFSARRTGRGEVIDIAAERVGALVTFQMSNASLYHQFGFRRLRHERGQSELTLYMARDGYVQMGAFRNLQPLLAVLEEFGAAQGLREVAADLPEGEFGRDPRVREAIAAFVSQRPRMEVCMAVQARNVMCVPVNDVADLVNDPFLNQREFFADVQLPGSDAPVKDGGVPFRMGLTPFQCGGRVPLPGQDNETVYARIGIDRDELQRLEREGVV
jgi:benzylsuccinate CoA-transferase BbsE subunit/naphthyl-2-methylsuccinate CoA transferase subunit